MEHVYIVQEDKTGRILAVYLDEDVAKKLMPIIETKLVTNVSLVRRKVNPNMDLIGNKLAEEL